VFLGSAEKEVKYMEPLTRIALCPHCGNEAPQQVVYQFETQLPNDDEGEPLVHRLTHTGGVMWVNEVIYFVAVCETCKNPLLCYFGSEFADEQQVAFRDSTLLWPTVGDLGDLSDRNLSRDTAVGEVVAKACRDTPTPPSVPDKVYRCYRKAMRTQKTDPRSYAVGIRRALEAICNDRCAVEGKLEKRLKDLASKNVIPPVLAGVSDVIRVVGNTGAHENQDRITAYDAAVINKFFLLVVEYVYILPKQVKEFKERLKDFGKSVAKTEDIETGKLDRPSTTLRIQ